MARRSQADRGSALSYPPSHSKEFALGVRSHITTADQVAFEVVPAGQLDYLLEDDEQPPNEQALVIADVGNEEEFVIFGTLGELTTLSHEMSEHCWAAEQRTNVRLSGIHHTHRLNAAPSPGKEAQLEPWMLQTPLLALVPQAIHEMRPLSFAERQAIATECSQTIAERSDRLMFPTPGGKPSGVLAALARGFAAAAYQPGGITTLGIHACVFAHPGCPALDEQHRPPCCTCGPGACSAMAAAACERCTWCANGCSTDGTCCPPRSTFGRVVLDDTP
ncbi:hypothetical protein [Nonomuraea sp. NPDC049784]|uniref:hypothetical protein n=1 Tax=Nonomuraea sp. NPDC049784 TaxID=3154361 RepID=UPI0034019455